MDPARTPGGGTTGEEILQDTFRYELCSAIHCDQIVGFTGERSALIPGEKSPPLWGRDNEGGKASDWSRIQNPAL